MRPGPAFVGGDLAMREVAENTPAGEAVGDPVTATVAGGGRLTYSLAGRDAQYFAIEANTGQINTAEPLDFEDPQDVDEDNDYQVTVKVEDERGGTSSAAVTITVTDVVEVSVTAVVAATPTPTLTPTPTPEATELPEPTPEPTERILPTLEPTPEVAEMPEPTAATPVEPVPTTAPEEGRSSLWWLLLLPILLVPALIAYRAYMSRREIRF